ASTSADTVFSMSSMPERKEASPKRPWSTATSKQRPSAAKRRFRRGFMPPPRVPASGRDRRPPRRRPPPWWQAPPLPLRSPRPPRGRPPGGPAVEDARDECVACPRPVDRLDPHRRNAPVEVVRGDLAAVGAERDGGDAGAELAQLAGGASRIEFAADCLGLGL